MDSNYGEFLDLAIQLHGGGFDAGNLFRLSGIQYKS